ncbi:MAG: 50S ribosomal protein L25 [Chitinophagaceae bacterium]|jgi:large subunit ribosomal protein L25|nr:50S ribosomal protein L25 [Chitinophagaceae bacterium]MBK7680646.1 50S ribosomal protein L25 [Chitinophagaceae bacterium]MBK8300550.1 50S ribosomal protein L25 [Chitinophagaceae bacterium]MBK9465059.1 50S ribosomal protein L25 [Chitinophagaceae bacterium]MBK9660208.1 50S ribosomal protein L25 [Chitinophagaceae bacterium]
MKSITIEGSLRTGFGKTATRQLRSQELVPGVIYGGPQEISFSAPAAAFKNFVYTPSFQVAEVILDGKTYRTILKDLQFDKIDDKLIHIDLLELVEDKKVIAEIPLKFVGTSKGVKDGGKLIIKIKSLKVKTFPKYLKEQIEVSIDNLELNGNIRVEDVKIDHYEILNSPRIPIASVVLTRQLKQEEATTAPAAKAAAPAAAPAAAAPAAAKGKK